MTENKKPTPERLKEYFRLSIVSQLKKQNKLLKKIIPMIPTIQKANKVIQEFDESSIMEKIEEFNRENDET